jgi:hypothetical protein
LPTRLCGFSECPKPRGGTSPELIDRTVIAELPKANTWRSESNRVDLPVFDFGDSLPTETTTRSHKLSTLAAAMRRKRLDVRETALLWGIKASFSEYIVRLPDGAFSATDGAEFLLPLTFAFESADEPSRQVGGEIPAPGSVLRFRGDVRFAGHAGALFLRLADPWLHFGEDRELGGFVSVVGGQTDDALERRTVAVFPRAGVTGGDDGRVTIDDVFLADDGVDLFNRVYATGTPLDSLFVGTYHRAIA